MPGPYKTSKQEEIDKQNEIDNMRKEIAYMQGTLREMQTKLFKQLEGNANGNEVSSSTVVRANDGFKYITGAIGSKVENDRNTRANVLLRDITNECEKTIKIIETQLKKNKKIRKNINFKSAIESVIDNPGRYSRKTHDLAKKHQTIQALLNISNSEQNGDLTPVAKLEELREACTRLNVLQVLDEKVDSKLMGTMKAIGRFLTKPMPKLRDVFSRFFGTSKPTATQQLKKQLIPKLEKSDEILEQVAKEPIQRMAPKQMKNASNS